MFVVNENYLLFLTTIKKFQKLKGFWVNNDNIFFIFNAINDMIVVAIALQLTSCQSNHCIVHARTYILWETLLFLFISKGKKDKCLLPSNSEVALTNCVFLNGVT